MIKFATPLKLVLLAALAITVVIGFIAVPEGTVLPVHWNMAGEPDGFLPRELALLMPVTIAALAWGIVVLVNRFAKPADRAAGAYVTGVVLTATTGMFLTIAVATVLIGVGTPVNMVQVIAVAIAVLLVVLGNAMPKSRPNSFAGLRIPTTLRSESNWRATHRFTGYLTIAGGVVLLGAALLVPVQVLIWWVLGCALSPLLAGVVFSLAVARRAE